MLRIWGFANRAVYRQMFPMMALESTDYFSAFTLSYKFSLPESEKEQIKGTGWSK